MLIQIRIHIRDPSPSFTHVEHLIFLNIFSQQCLSTVHCFIFLVSVIGVIIFNILDSMLKFLEKVEIRRYGLGSSKMMPIRPAPDPGPQYCAKKEGVVEVQTCILKIAMPKGFRHNQKLSVDPYHALKL
jgi:hypothetical protein